MEHQNKKHKTCDGSAPPDAKSDISDDESQTGGVPNDKVIAGSASASREKKSGTSPNEQVQSNANLSCSSQLLGNVPSSIPKSSSSAIPNPWHQFVIHGGNVNELPQGQPVPPMPQHTMPFWMPRNPGQYFPGAYHPAFYQSMPTGGTANPSRPGACIGNSWSQQQNTNFYPFGFPYPGFPGPWDPASWMSQQNQSRPPPCGSGFQGPFNQFAYFQASMPCSQVPSDPSPQSVKPPVSELPQEQQKLWEAQSLQNFQLWNFIGKLQGELDEYKRHVKKLESDLEALKSVSKEASNQGTSAYLGEKASKLVFPERLLSMKVPMHSSRPPVGNQKAGVGLVKVKSETRELHFEKVILKKADNIVPIVQNMAAKGTDTQTANHMENKESSFISSSVHSTQNHQGASTAVYNGKGDSNMCFTASQPVGRTVMISSSTNDPVLASCPSVKIEQQ